MAVAKSETVHIPAWKKLGLKLKYAREHDEEDTIDRGTDGHDTEEVGEEKGKADGAEKQTDEDNASNKKRKLGDNGEEGNGQQTRKKNKKMEIETDAGAETESGDASRSPTKEKEGAGGEKKVVRFATDGDADGQNKDMSDEEEEEEDEETKQMKQRKREKKKERKRQEKEKSTTTAPDSDSKTPIITTTTGTIQETPMLSYLSRFYKNRSEWKFQKSREVHLFKHVLSLEHVPVQYNAALLAYLKGLRSEGAKQRLSETAEGIIKSDTEEKANDENADANTDNAEEKATTDQSQSQSYAAAVEAFRDRLPEASENNDAGINDTSQKLDNDDLQRRLWRRQRAELMWFVIHDGQLYGSRKPKEQPTTKKSSEGQAGAAAVQRGQSNNARKKKKSRTAVVEISSSESEDDSDSDSDSDFESSSSSDSSSSSS